VKQQIIHDWLLKGLQLTGKSLTRTQLEQAWARMFFAAAGLLYTWLHGSSFAQYGSVFLAVAACYFLYTGLTILTIPRYPLSAFRTITSPMLDIFVVSFAMLVDGGQHSGIYFIYLVIIFGNCFRFGNAMLLYTQGLSLIGLLAMTAFVYGWPPNGIDLSLLCWQLATLLALPAYVYLIGQNAEDAIKARYEAEKSSFNLLDKGPVPVFTFELDDADRPCVLYANKATNVLFGHRHTMLVGEYVDTLVLPEDRDEMVRFCLETLAMEESAGERAVNHLYIRGKQSSGNMLKLTCTAIRMNWQNRWIGVCFMLDITQRELLQEQLEAVHKRGYMSTMVAGIVHDFRNVLNNMIGYAELLHMSSVDADSRMQLEAIMAAGDRGSEMITHLLKLSKRQDSEIATVKTSSQMLTGPLENIIGLTRLQMPAHIQLVCEIKKPLPDVAISVIEVEQILLNLINNAMQAMTSAGKICIRIGNDQQHRLASAEQGALSIRVSDDGPGIASENLDKVFKPFWTTRSDTGGSGLGLAMVQRIVKRHHGTITIDSVTNQQTTFSIHIPPFQGEATATTETPLIPAAIQSPAPAPCHCLLVDDAPDILKIHKAMLSRMGHSVDTAENGQQALALLNTHGQTYDLLITDYRMPVMDGLELIEQIRMLNIDMPILMVTAYGEDRNLQRAGQYGAMLISKPVTIARLSQAIGAAMQAKRDPKT